MDTGSLQIFANPCKFSCQLCPKKFFFSKMSFPQTVHFSISNLWFKLTQPTVYICITLKCFASLASVALLQHLWIHLSLYLYATFEMLKVQEIAINQSKFSQFFSLLVNGAKAARIKNTKKNILRQFYKTWSHVTCWIL